MWALVLFGLTGSSWGPSGSVVAGHYSTQAACVEAATTAASIGGVKLDQRVLAFCIKTEKP